MSSIIVVTADPAIVVAQDDPAITMVLPVTAQPYDYNGLANRPALGSAALLNAGTAANEVVQLDSSGRLPALDASQLTNLVMKARALNCGRLVHVSSTSVAFIPLRGNLIQINGSLYEIPAAGIQIANTSASGPSALNYVYAYMNGATMALELSTTGHVTSATAGNIGTEIKSGDDTRSLVGMVYTNASSQFVDTIANRQVRSWFNDSGVATFGNSTTTISTTSTTMVELDVAARCFALLWANEQFEVDVKATVYNNTAGQVCFTTCWVNGAALGQDHYAHSASANFATVQTAGGAGVAATDSLVTASAAGKAGANSAIWSRISTQLTSVRK